MKYIVLAVIIAVVSPFIGFWIIGIVATLGVLLAAYAVISPFLGGEEWLARKVFRGLIPFSWLYL